MIILMICPMQAPLRCASRGGLTEPAGNRALTEPGAELKLKLFFASAYAPGWHDAALRTSNGGR